MNDKDIAIHVMERSCYLTLATSTKDGLPWCSPLAYAYNKAYEFFWYSSPEARHSENIHENPRVSAVLYDTFAREGSNDIFTTSLYMEGVAHLVSDEDVPKSLDIIYKRFNKNASLPRRKAKNFIGTDAPRRVYLFKPQKFSLLLPKGDPRYKDIYVDCRKEICF